MGQVEVGGHRRAVREFYSHVAHDFEAPLAWAHARVEGRQEFTQLFYVPARAQFDLWDRDKRHGVKLYIKRVFIMDAADQLLPAYLRFVRGIVDSSDLPLNVSREILQQSSDVAQIRSASVKRVLGLLEDPRPRSRTNTTTFWKEFGKVLKGRRHRGPRRSRARREAADSPPRTWTVPTSRCLWLTT